MLAEPAVVQPSPERRGRQTTSAVDGRPLWDEWSLGIRTWGEDPHGDCVLLVGTYRDVEGAEKTLGFA